MLYYWRMSELETGPNWDPSDCVERGGLTMAKKKADDDTPEPDEPKPDEKPAPRRGQDDPGSP